MCGFALELEEVSEGSVPCGVSYERACFTPDDSSPRAQPERVVKLKPTLGLAVSTRLMDLAAGGPGPKDDMESMFNE